MVVELLRKIGLSEGEIKVYSVLLHFGLSSVNKIHEKTGIERRNIYDILNKLIGRGLCTYSMENQKRLFQISHPQKIMDYVADKKNELEKVENEVKKELPHLANQFNSRLPDIYSEVYRGPEGIKAIWEDTLQYDAVYWIGSGRYLPQKFPIWFRNWNKKRVEKKVQWINLMREEMREKIKHPLDYEEIRYLPTEFSGSPIVIGVYGDKVINFLLGEQLFGFMIQSKELAENYKRYHHYLWKKVAKP